MKRFGLFQNLSNDLAVRMAGSAFVSVALLAVFSSMSGCKEPIEPRKSTPTPSPSPIVQGAGALGQTDPRCSQADFVCSVASDLVTLCKEKEPTNTSCSDTVWTKVQWQRIVDLQKAGPIGACPSETWYVNTKTDPLLMRSSAEIKDGNVVNDVDRGESVKCVGIEATKDQGEWMKAKANDGVEGYMKKEFLSTTKPAGGAATGGATKPTVPTHKAGAAGICVRDVIMKNVAQGKPDGGTCDSLAGQPHKGSFGRAWPNETIVSCIEQRSGSPIVLKEGWWTWGCLCNVKKRVEQLVQPNTACPPKWWAK